MSVSIRVGAWIRRNIERSVAWLPYFPDPDARCPAHGDAYCRSCAANPGSCGGHDGECGYWFKTGMHWDTCPNRVRSY